jgi:glutamate racemase
VVTTNVTNSGAAGITVYDEMYWSLPVASMWGYLDYNFTLPYGNYVVLVENTGHIIVSRTNVMLNQPVVYITLQG